MRAGKHIDRLDLPGDFTAHYLGRGRWEIFTRNSGPYGPPWRREMVLSESPSAGRFCYARLVMLDRTATDNRWRPQAQTSHVIVPPPERKPLTIDPIHAALCEALLASERLSAAEALDDA